jgi:hypothetical protein
MSRSITPWILTLMIVMLSACQGLQPVGPDEPASPEVPTVVEDVAANAPEIFDASASEDASSDPEVSAEPPPKTVYRFLMNTLTFPFAVSTGVVRGFDLDDNVSDGTKPEDCDWEDFVSPDGMQGIDNQMARLTPLFEPAGLGQAFDYLESSIEDSGFFHLFELRGVDDLVNDDEVELIYELGGGSALMDPEGNLVPNQTMCVQNDSPHLVADSARIVDGVLLAEFNVLTFMFSMFERVYPFVFTGAHFKARFNEEGHLVEGLIGGTLAMSDLLALVAKGAQNTGGLLGPMTALLTPLGDMPSGDGPCAALSSVFDFSAIPVFFFPLDSGCDPCGNGVCEYFEACETCLQDCCLGCGNGVCDVYANVEHPVTVTEEGFDAVELDVMVGDVMLWTNGTDGPINLLCEGGLGNHTVDAGEVHDSVATESGIYGCRVHELPGQLQTLSITDNHSENCQSCPGDCGDCE